MRSGYGTRAVAAPVYLHHPSSLEHDTGAHPERIARIPAIERELERRDWLGYERELAPPADPAQLHAVHPPAYVEAIEALSAAGGGAIDADTVTSAGSYEAALHAAGGAATLVDRLLTGAAPTGFSGTRPPGHHAEPARAMGFCLFNNVAVAARHALDAHGAERVLVVDWDVHHGNGTNDIFHATPEVLFVSIHESPLYPGTGPASDVGSGEGTGYTVNLPVPHSSGDETFCSLVEHVVLPLARAYEPRLVLISAGYDAHAGDPLATCEVTDAGYATMTGSLRRLAAELDVPLGIVLEGGYELGALARSVAATLEVAAGEPGGAPELARHPLATDALGRLAQWWPMLAAA
jgi:acetoin utilization deacetylase AcuC-like enzyme